MQERQRSRARDIWASMRIPFAKWHGTGNDFILVDDRMATFPVTDLSVVRRLCDRHFGIGSDGLILIQQRTGVDYHMEFFNPDGSKSFCGNGSRCAFAFWRQLVGGRDEAVFTAIDGEHRASAIGAEVSVSLRDVGEVVLGEDHDRLHNGSPHEVVRVIALEEHPVRSEGAARAHAERQRPGGSNVNFIRVDDGVVHVRTFERGVEDETLSCGTGVVASAISAIARGEARAPVSVVTRGGNLRVAAELRNGTWTDIRLIGPAEPVFEGVFTF